MYGKPSKVSFPHISRPVCFVLVKVQPLATAMTGISEKVLFFFSLFFFLECFTIAFLYFSCALKPASRVSLTVARTALRWIYASNSVRLSHFGRIKEKVTPDFAEINGSFMWTQTKWSYSAHMPNFQSNGSCKTVLLSSCQQLDLMKVPPAFWEGILSPLDV